MRTELLSYLTGQLSTSTVKTSAELPFSQGQQPLYLKNMKRIYLDTEAVTDSTLIPVFGGQSNVNEQTKSVRAYFTVDAKSTITNLTSVISTMLNAKTQVGEDGTTAECDYSTEINEDVVLYTFEYRTTKITF